jgi:hypothetical protein
MSVVGLSQLSASLFFQAVLFWILRYFPAILPDFLDWGFSLGGVGSQ